MTFTIEIPDAALSALRESYAEMPRAMIESLAVEGYRSGRLSSFTVGQMLGHESRWQTQDFLAAHDAWPAQSVEEFDREIKGLTELRMS
jgi:hypothetical protein